MGTTKYWKGLDELNSTPEFEELQKKEFAEELSVDEFLSDSKVQEASTARRDFLKFLGFSVAAATIASCESPVVKAVPYAVKPEEVYPGIPNWYASTYYDGTSYASILVKSREGRPIHIKGNKDRGITKGAVNPQIAGSVLGLYDGERLTNPMVAGQDESWETVDGAISSKLKSIVGKGKKVVLLSNTVISPSTLSVIEEFKSSLTGEESTMDMVAAPVDVAGEEMRVDANGEEGAAVMPNIEEPVDNSLVQHVQYDAVSYSGMRAANKESFGQNIIPDYDFSKAKVIVSVAADFLNSWLLPTQFTGQYLERRNPDGEWMSRHFQFETNMSITGSNADVRGMIKPSQQGAVLALLHKEVTGSALSGVDTSSLNEVVVEQIKMAADELKAAKGSSLVVAGSNRKSIQVVVNSINNALNNYTGPINLSDPINLYQSEDEKMEALITDLSAGKIGAILTWDCNPVYSHPRGEEFKAGLAKAELSVSMSMYADETGANCEYNAPASHTLESWEDFCPKNSHYAIAQPTIRPLHDTRPAAESLMVWAGMAEHVGKDSKNYYDYIRMVWEKWGYPGQTAFSNFEDYWNDAVHYSTAKTEVVPAVPMAFSGNTSAAAKDIASISAGSWELSLYQKAGIGVGVQANNPWLQEMPDPISKVTWDNYITMAPSDMEANGYATEVGQRSESNLATVSVGEKSLTLPVFAQPGQMPGTIGIALGYGRGANGEKIGKAAYQIDEFGKNDAKTVIGANGFALINNGEGDAYDVAVSKSEGTYTLACTQTHSTVMARNSIVKETTLEIYKTKGKSAYNHQHVLHSGWNHDEKPVTEFNLWDEHPVEKVGHRWGMSIDLNSCIGCGSCLIACQSENNVPVVGRDEVRRSREMHWLRLDRYYAADTELTVGTRDEDKFNFDDSEIPSQNPKVVHMPMMCHHCNHAPCETVCPVAATTHSNEGLNQMTYNRCIGTRYCANNCPYKVRRFNWFNYPSYRKFENVNPSQDDLGRMVLNPDVVVRTRGVMEKCSMCVQRIQSGKLAAKKADRPVMDGEVTTACADVCPTNAIIMGDWNDDNSAIKAASESDRAYQVLEEVGIKPNIWYQVKVRNHKNEALAAAQVEHHGGHGGDHGEGHEGEEHGDEHAHKEGDSHGEGH
ncbi:MAG: TAT-variant-translocated molybdopterin oxidoreductase [Crocinitomicaceae bacterium]|nr:TAT-variant-translocated molybdopterin oxidoreductase [Crocinitomicaceae bacterium]